MAQISLLMRKVVGENSLQFCLSEGLLVGRFLSGGCCIRAVVDGGEVSIAVVFKKHESSVIATHVSVDDRKQKERPN